MAWRDDTAIHYYVEVVAAPNLEAIACLIFELSKSG